MGCISVGEWFRSEDGRFWSQGDKNISIIFSHCSLFPRKGGMKNDSSAATYWWNVTIKMCTVVRRLYDSSVRSNEGSLQLTMIVCLILFQVCTATGKVTFWGWQASGMARRKWHSCAGRAWCWAWTRTRQTKRSSGWWWRKPRNRWSKQTWRSPSSAAMRITTPSQVWIESLLSRALLLTR